jgi:transposase
VDRLSLESWLAQGLSLKQIGVRVGRHPSTVSYWLKKHGLAAVHAERHAARSLVDTDALPGLVDAGATQRQLAETLRVSEATVKYWLRKLGLQTERAARLAETRTARKEGSRMIRRSCSRHGATEYVLEGRGSYRCARCRMDAVARRRRVVKETLVREAGGCCQICGYDRYIGALQFHHLDPNNKVFSLSDQGISRSLAKAREEARKCIVLCSRCHAEVEAGMVQIVPYNGAAVRGSSIGR